MKRIGAFLALLILIGSGACAQKGDKGSTRNTTLENEMDSVSYIMGASLATNMRKANIEDVDLERLIQGIKDGMKGDSSLVISMGDGNEFIMAYMRRKKAEEAEKAKEVAQTFMAEQEATGEYQKTESGILYKVIEQGEGQVPVETDVVKVHYEGTNMKGEVFDSSYQRGTPSEFPANRVIRGWTEMLKMMPVGSTYMVVIPPDLAYGERGSPPKIGTNEPLTFKIELIDIVRQDK